MKSTTRLHMGWMACLVAAGLSATTSMQAQPITLGHLNAGALGTNQNDKLVWANGAAFAASSGFYYNMSYATNGTYAGYFNSAPTLTALPATTLPAGLPPAWGSFIQVQLTLVSGPVGGTFSFWTNSLGVKFDLGVGDSTPLINLSDPLTAGDPGEDPFGHLHGRRFTTTLPGDYIVDLRLFDVSANGIGGGPIHAPSDAFLMDFRTVPEPTALALLGLGLGGIALMRAKRK